ncbi:MAG: hypothetical protein V1685_04870, partial [Parcubacteria group bacterium]
MKRLLFTLWWVAVVALLVAQNRPTDSIQTSAPPKLVEKYVVNCNRIWHVWIDGPLMQTEEKNYDVRTVMVKLQ